MPQLLSVQILRAAAAFAVVICHVGITLNYWGKADLQWPLVGAAGVDLFFVISGFIMVALSWDSFAQAGEPIKFFVRRLVRIVPLYWLLTTIYVVGGKYDIWRAVGSYLFVWTGEQQPVVGVGWSLNFEMFFYVIFAACMMMPRAVALVSLSAALIAVTLVRLPFYSDPIVLEFLFGVFVAIAYRRGVRLIPIARVLLVMVGVAAIIYWSDSVHDGFRWGVPAALIVAGAVLGSPIERRTPIVMALVAVGDASYALYLIHVPIVRVIADVMRSAGLDLVRIQPIYFVIATAAAIGAALLVYRFVELPLLALLKSRTSQRRPAAAEIGVAAALNSSHTPS